MSDRRGPDEATRRADQRAASLRVRLVRAWASLGPKYMPFADVATAELPLGRLLRLSLFQVSVGMAMVLLTGTLNRVMIVELGMSAWLVGAVVSLPLVFAPFRALLGFRSDTHRSAIGWRRVPFIWSGTMLQFGGFAIMPFALFIMSGDATNGPVWIGHVASCLAFLLVGAGLHTTQTAGLALASDIAPEAARPRVVALLYVMLLVGMFVSALVFGWLLRDFSQVRLVKVVQGVALATFILNVIALWKQEARAPGRNRDLPKKPSFRAAWATFRARPGAMRFLWAVGLGTAAFSMQDVLLEPYGGEILRLDVSDTTTLTAFVAAGTLCAFGVAARLLGTGFHALRLAALGALVGTVAFAAVMFAAPLESAMVFRIGTALIGFGGGLFTVGTLTFAMSQDDRAQNGLVIGAWGAVQATAAGVAIAAGAALRDIVGWLGHAGWLGPLLDTPSAGYNVVYNLEIVLLFLTLAALGPLVRMGRAGAGRKSAPLGMAELPG
jgi:BCD family chlorophyll transporter-like MFS transporter